MILETRAAVAQPGVTSRRFPRPTLFGRAKSVGFTPSVVNLITFSDQGFQRNRLRADGHGPCLAVAASPKHDSRFRSDGTTKPPRSGAPPLHRTFSTGSVAGEPLFRRSVAHAASPAPRRCRIRNPPARANCSSCPRIRLGNTSSRTTLLEHFRRGSVVEPGRDARIRFR